MINRYYFLHAQKPSGTIHFHTVVHMRSLRARPDLVYKKAKEYFQEAFGTYEQFVITKFDRVK